MTATEMVPLPDDYAEVLAVLKNQVRQSRATAQRRVNTKLIALYWGIDRQIMLRQEPHWWGSWRIRVRADLEHPGGPRGLFEAGADRGRADLNTFAIDPAVPHPIWPRLAGPRAEQVVM